MPKVNLVALKQFRYGGKLMQPGQEFQTPGQTDALRLRAFKMAAPAPEAPPAPPPEPDKPKRAYTRKVVSAEATVPAPTRTYHRRDMVAEGE